MTEVQFAANPHYREYEALLIRLHQLIAQGRGDTEEAEALCEEMDVPHQRLSPGERSRLEGLSADLFMLQDDETFEPASPAERTRGCLGRELEQAWHEGHWDRVLSLLRKGPDFLSAEQLAVIRAFCYEQLGHHETSLLFLEYAAQSPWAQPARCSG